MKDKVLIKLIIPEIDNEFDIFIPVNEVVWKIKKLILKAVSDISDTKYLDEKNYILINQDNSHIYDSNDIIINTDIRNGTVLLFLFNGNRVK